MGAAQVHAYLCPLKMHGVLLLHTQICVSAQRMCQ